MAEIREELELVDKFSATFGKFLALGDKMAEACEKISEEMERMASTSQKTSDKTTTGFKDSDRAANGLINTIKRLAIAVGGITAIKGMISLSDDLTLTAARLANINDGLQTNAELQQMIYESAQRSRGEYVGMMNTVAKLKAQTGNTFASVREAAAFTELLQKQFKLAGTDAVGISSTMYNLTQALSTGVLRGQDLNIVFSNAPQLVQRIADYMNVPIGQIRKMAEQGQITADIVKNAMLSAGDDINKQFEEMPLTFSDAVQKIQNYGIVAFEPIKQVIADSIGSATFTEAAARFTDGMAVMAQVAALAFGAVGGAAQFAMDVWDRFGSVIMTVAGFVVAYEAVIWGVHAAMSAYTAVMAVAATLKQAYAFATGSATLAQVGFNVALGTTVAMVLGIVAVIGILIFGFHKIANTGHTVFGDLCGVLNVVRMFFVNIGLTAAMIAMKLGATFAVCARNIKTAFGNAISGVKGWFYQLMSTALTVIGNIAAKLNELPFIEFDFSGITSAAQEYAGKAAAEYAKKQEYEDVNSTVNEVGGHLDDIWGNDWVGNAMSGGQSWGDDIQNSITSGFKSIGGSIDGLGSGLDFGDIYGAQNDLTDLMGGGTNGGKANVGSVDKVKKVEDCKLSDEDLKIYRDLAERKYLNNIELQTLAPNISVTMPQGEGQHITAQDVADRIKVMLIEQAAAHTAVSHA
jgi:tape measure domain-containing protein